MKPRCLVFISTLVVCGLTCSFARAQAPVAATPNPQPGVSHAGAPVSPAAMPQVKLIPLAHAKAAELAVALRELVPVFEGRRIGIAVHRGSNTVIVAAGEEECRIFEAIVQYVDQRVGQRQNTKLEGAARPAESPPLADSRRWERLRDKLAVAKELAALRQTSLAAGQASPADVYDALRQVRQAELELCGDSEGPLAVLQRAVADAQEFETRIDQGIHLGLATASDRLVARLARLNAEIALLERVSATR